MPKTTKKQRIIEALNRILEEEDVTKANDTICLLAYNIAKDTGGIGMYCYDGKVFFKDEDEGALEYHALGRVCRPARVKLRY